MGAMARAGRFGELERAVLEVLWEASASEWRTVRDVHVALATTRDVAYTTVMTVLDRLARKGQVTQQRDGRAYRYQARAGRGELTAELMRETLDEFAQHDRRSALLAFVEDADADEVAALRQALADLEGA